MNDSFDLAYSQQAGFNPAVDFTSQGFNPAVDFTSQTALEHIKNAIDSVKQTHNLPPITTFQNVNFRKQKGWYNFVCQIIGIVFDEQKQRPYLRVTDGTVFESDISITKAVDSGKSRSDTKLEGMLQGYLVDICCWDEFSDKAMEYKPGDIVKLGNVEVKRLNTVITVDLHGASKAPPHIAQIRGIWFLENGWDPEPESKASQSTAPGAFNSSENIMHSTPIPDSLALSPKVKRQKLQSVSQATVVDETLLEEKIGQEERAEEILGQHVISQLQQLTPNQKKRADTEIREFMRGLIERLKSEQRYIQSTQGRTPKNHTCAVKKLRRNRSLIFWAIFNNLVTHEDENWKLRSAKPNFNCFPIEYGHDKFIEEFHNASNSGEV
ncbi:ssDNA-binding domain of telomere protection protein [Ditylenchus destructor]|nr:ssDNA-binding domain of telomere protection protein [Ditylenchus destructor]